MKRTLISIIVVVILNTNLKAQIEPVNFELEKTSFKYSLNSGVYKYRISGASEKENSFE